jgi:predicted ribosomally synthesized peptide with SipW-like signal peptide
MKKIIFLSVALIAVISMMGVGTWAYFNDVVTSTGNSVTAGKLVLTGDGFVSTPFHIGGSAPYLKPGDNGTAGQTVLVNDGNIDGDLYILSDNVTNNENDLLHPEIAAGDEGPADEPNGELGGLLKLAIWVDINGTGWTENTDFYINNSGNVVSTGTSGSIDGNLPDAAYTWTADTLLAAFDTEKKIASNVPAGTIGTLKVAYYFPDGGGSHFGHNSDNLAQDDDITFDLAFALVQAGY